MDPIPHETYRSTMKSRHRRRMIILLSSLGEAYVGQLARMLGLPATRVRWIMKGHGRAYSEELAPLTLGLATEHFDDRGRRFYRITAAGRRKARSMTASRVRKSTKHEDAFL